MNADWYFAHFENSWTDETPISQVRFVVLDSETTGLDPRRDRLITIGAVAVENGEIRLNDSFEALFKLDYNHASVTVHGITRDEASEGMDEPEALELFLNYLRDGVIVGHHIGHDVQTLNAGYGRHFDMQLKNRTLDALCEMFGISPHDRHTAGGDAFITAQVFLRLLHAARRAGRTSVASISIPYPTG
jgi:DNA polymerase-3 subunit epsilon